MQQTATLERATLQHANLYQLLFECMKSDVNLTVFCARHHCKRHLQQIAY